MSDNWYYTNGGQQQGPVPLEHLKSWLTSGQLQASELVWREGMPNWIAASQVPELQGLAPATSGAAAAGFGQQPMTGGAAPAFAVNYYTPIQTAEYSGFWLRFVAWIIDDILIIALPFWILSFLVQMAFGMQPTFAAPGSPPPQPPPPAYIGVSLLLNLANIVVGWLYAALLTSGPHMATFGKRAVGIRVTDLNGQRISFGRATGRHFAKILSGCTLLIGYLMAAFTERKQGLHDMIASTLVLKGKAPQ